MYDTTSEADIIMSKCAAHPAVSDVSQFWVEHYGKQVGVKTITPEVGLQCLVTSDDTADDSGYKKKKTEPDIDSTDIAAYVAPQEADSDMAGDIQLVSPVQGVVDQARAIKKRRASSRKNTDNAKRRRKARVKVKRRRRKKKGKRPRKKKKIRKKSTKKKNKKKRKNKKKKGAKAKRRVKKKSERQRDIFN